MGRYGPDPTEAARLAKAAGCRIVESERIQDGTWSHRLECKSHAAKVKFLAQLTAYDARQPAVRRAAERVVAMSGAANAEQQIRALHRFVRDSVTFTKEPGEIFSPTMRVLELGVGDCDDSARALGALLGSLGHRVALLTLGYPPRHVAAGVRTSVHMGAVPPRGGTEDGWSWLETTIKAEPYEHPLTAAERLGITTRKDIRSGPARAHPTG